MTRWAAAIALSLLFSSPVRAAAPCVVRYLVDERVHVALIFRDDGRGGAFAWRDTVTGRRGDAGFEARHGFLLVSPPEGEPFQVRILPDVALLFDTAPWSPNGVGATALGVALN